MSPCKNKIGLFIVNYGNDEITSQCVDSFKNEPNLDIYVLNNKNQNSRIKDNLENAKVVQMNKNHGYFGALIKFGREVELNYDWYVLSNNDILLKSHFSIPILELEKKNKDLGAIAPSIVEMDGKELNPHLINPLSRLEKIYFRLYYKNYFLAIILRKTKQLIFKNRKNSTSYNQNIYSANGAMLILNREIFKEILKSGNLGFLYGEEILVAETCKRCDKKIYFTDQIKLLHYHSETTGKKYSKNKFNWQKETYDESIQKKYKHYQL